MNVLLLLLFECTFLPRDILLSPVVLLLVSNSIRINSGSESSLLISKSELIFLLPTSKKNYYKLNFQPKLNEINAEFTLSSEPKFDNSFLNNYKQ